MPKEVKVVIVSLIIIAIMGVVGSCIIIYKYNEGYKNGLSQAKNDIINSMVTFKGECHQNYIDKTINEDYFDVFVSDDKQSGIFMSCDLYGNMVVQVKSLPRIFIAPSM